MNNLKPSVLKKNFSSRQECVEYVKSLAPWAEGDPSVMLGGHPQGQKRLAGMDPLGYSKTRNYGHGKVTGLSPYIHHGVITLHEVRRLALKKTPSITALTPFIQELAWRDFWQRVAQQHPDWLWEDVEDYKTGLRREDYADSLPEDIARGRTGVACMDAFIGDLLRVGYVHNHARMYLASYLVHFRRIKWQVGARWFLEHLLDGDEASNNLSWQWVASTFSNRPYIFNLENVAKYFGESVDTSPSRNRLLDASYEELQQRLFPSLSLRGDHE